MSRSPSRSYPKTDGLGGWEHGMFLVTNKETRDEEEKKKDK